VSDHHRDPESEQHPGDLPYGGERPEKAVADASVAATVRKHRLSPVSVEELEGVAGARLLAYLAGALLVGLLGNAVIGAGWLDPLVGLAMPALPSAKASRPCAAKGAA
jgi:hypothetical protein